MQFLRSAIVTSLLATLLAVHPVSAMPLSRAVGATELATELSSPLPTIEVRHSGAAVAAGIIGGMMLGGIIASQAPRYYPPYAYYPAYPGAAAYCARRFKSYDPVSMTYLGYDGFRHPCP